MPRQFYVSLLDGCAEFSGRLDESGTAMPCQFFVSLLDSFDTFSVSFDKKRVISPSIIFPPGPCWMHCTDFGDRYPGPVEVSLDI